MSDILVEKSKHKGNARLLLNSHFFAKVALVLAVLCGLGIALVIVFVTGKTGGSYSAINRSFSLSYQSLGPTMLVAGLFMVAFAGFVTWIFAAYTSHYVAGPLFGFARNFQSMIEHGVAARIPLRKNDQLKQEEEHIQRSVTKLQLHHDGMRNAAEAALAQLDGRQPATAISRLKELDRATRL